MAADPDPPRKFYGLKPKAFERVNDLPAPTADHADPAAPAPAATSEGRIDVRDLARTANAGVNPLQKTEPAVTPNDVHALLQENLARANAAGLNDVAPQTPRRSRRKLHYWALLVLVNAFFGFLAFGPFANPATFVYGIAGMVLFTCGFTWTMWFVMDDY